MTTSIAFNPVELTIRERRTYLFAGLFIAGNLLLPQLAHLIPQGGPMFLPIYFFTLIAAYKYGWKVGILTAIASPLANHALFGMPMMAMLPVILIKSSLLAVFAALIAQKSQKVSLGLLALVILSYQILGGLGEWAITSSFVAAVQDFKLGFPGLLIQWILGWQLLKKMA